MRDYCDDPADAWPIIEKYQIGLEPVYQITIAANRKSEDEWWTAKSHNSEGWPIRGSDRNALKAAMLCFLEMEINDDK